MNREAWRATGHGIAKTGFIGSHLCDHLLENNHQVIAVDNLLTGKVENISHIRSPHRLDHEDVDTYRGTFR